MSDTIYQKRWQWLGTLVLVVALGSLVVGDFVSDHRGPQAPTEIFAGITYGRERLETTQEGRGFLHWVRIDLTAGIELYWGGKVWPGSSHSLDSRTVVAVDQQRKL